MGGNYYIMKEIRIETWEDFENAIRELEAYRLKKIEEHKYGISELLFRGQGDESWGLSTTLERYKSDIVSLRQYHRYLQRIRPAVESYTGRTWELDNADSFDTDFVHNLPGYPMMVYARHHGFPSPLLDWTLSPYIALFFAFSTPTKAERVAVYGFIETPEGVKGGFVGQPEIRGQGPYATTHERHFTQQAQYTICIEKPKDEWNYSSHDSYFSSANDEQDYIRKITLPQSLRQEVLTRLDLMNINDYSLFRTEEGLMRMLAFREVAGKKF